MKVGDLVQIKKLTDTWFRGGNPIGAFAVYVGQGSWAGWGRFLLPDGRRGQFQLSDVEVMNESR